MAPEVAGREELRDHADQRPAEGDRAEQDDAEGGVAQDAEHEEVPRLAGRGGDGHRDPDGEQAADRLLDALPPDQAEQEDEQRPRRARPRCPVRRPSIALATMKATVGTVASTMPRQPPSCSSTRWRSKSAGSAAGGAAGSGSGAASRGPSVIGSPVALTPASWSPVARPGARLSSSTASRRGRSAGAELVPGVVDDPLAVEGGEPAAGGDRAARARCPGCAGGPARPASPSRSRRTARPRGWARSPAACRRPTSAGRSP